MVHLCRPGFATIYITTESQHGTVGGSGMIGRACPRREATGEALLTPDAVEPSRQKYDFHPINIYIFICVYIYIYACMYIYICIYLYMDICIFTYMFMICVFSYIFMYLYVCVCIYVCVYIHIYVCVYTFVYVRMHVCMYVDLDTYSYINRCM